MNPEPTIPRHRDFSAGEVTATYQKVHLFDVEVPGGAILNETKLVAPGEDVVVQRLVTSSGTQRLL